MSCAEIVMPPRFSRQPERVVRARRLERTALKFVDLLPRPPRLEAEQSEDTFRTPNRCSFLCNENFRFRGGSSGRETDGVANLFYGWQLAWKCGRMFTSPGNLLILELILPPVQTWCGASTGSVRYAWGSRKLPPCGGPWSA
eukprot:6148198-Prymnesium_polylepis.1